MQTLLSTAVNLDSCLMQACRILVELNLDSGPFGNISIRTPRTDEFIQNPNGLTFDQVQLEDVITVHEDGWVVKGVHPPHPGEVIHREIYRLRPDVSAVVHTHSDATVAFSLLGSRIGAYTQLGASLANDQGLYLGFSGPVRDVNEGRTMALALGTGSILIAKNHGVFATGIDIQSALWNFVVADMACRIHLQALQFGIFQVDSLLDVDLSKSRRAVRDQQCHSMWGHYVAKLNQGALKQRG